jgi:serine/threonine protein kinase
MLKQKNHAAGNILRPRASTKPTFPTIAGYRFLQNIARSPSSEVHLAYSEELRHNVAVKVLGAGTETTIDPDDAQRFDRERSILTRLRHPAIVDVYDWGQGADFRYIVTEYFQSGSLELRIRNLMRVRDSVDIFVQIAGALVVLHDAGLCHRDLKPANVMMRPNGGVVLIDFGLAKRVDNATQLTGAGEVRGSPYYIAPEQAEGLATDQRTDLYSLGIMFYEMLTGHRPYKGNSVISIIQAHRNDPIPQLPSELGSFQRLLDGLIAKKPDERFPTAHSALATLAKMKV